MTKALKDITTLGLINGQNGLRMFKEIWDRYYGGVLDDGIRSHIINHCIYDDNFKVIDPLLESFIGVYPLNIEGISDMWSPEFVNKFNTWMGLVYSTRASFQQKPDAPTSLYSLKSYLYNILIFATDFNSGYVYEANRKIKVLKYLKNKVQQCIEITDAEFEKLDWYKFYMMKKETRDQLYLVITNSVASQLGMSSYAPERNNERVWGSCQRIDDHNDGYARCVPSNLTDKGSLIMYITDGSDVDFFGMDDYDHQVMICRWMLRLLKRPNDDGYMIAIDRAYPHDAYAGPVFTQVLQLCKANDLPLTMYTAYNAGQSKIYFDYDELFNKESQIKVKSAHPIKYSEVIHKKHYCSDCSYCENRCPGCNKHGTNDDCEWHDQVHCGRCRSFSEDCLDRDCAECDEHRSRCVHESDEESRYTHYDDQAGGSCAGSYNESDQSYVVTYYVREPISEIPEMTIETTLRLGQKVKIKHCVQATWFGNTPESYMVGRIGVIKAISDGSYGVDFGVTVNGGDNLYGILPEGTARWYPFDVLEIVTNKPEQEREAA